MGNMMPQGATFRWESKPFYTTTSAAVAGIRAAEDSLRSRGLEMFGGFSGGGAWIPSECNYGATVKLLRSMGDAEARQMIEDTFGNTFTFFGALTAVWKAQGQTVGFVASETKKDVEKKVGDVVDAGKDIAKGATIGALLGGSLAMATIIVGVISLAVIASKAK